MEWQRSGRHCSMTILEGMHWLKKAKNFGKPLYEMSNGHVSLQRRSVVSNVCYGGWPLGLLRSSCQKQGQRQSEITSPRAWQCTKPQRSSGRLELAGWVTQPGISCQCGCCWTSVTTDCQIPKQGLLFGKSWDIEMICKSLAGFPTYIFSAA